MDDIGPLYESYTILSEAKEDAGQHQKSFEVILAGVKGSAGAKKLAADFICKFVQYFPDLAERAIESQLDLCEEEDAKIRMQAIRNLPQLARDNADNSQIGDILTQLLQTEDKVELKIVENALSTLLEKDARGALAGLFYQVNNGESEVIREKALLFMSTNLVSLAPKVLHTNEEIERYVVDECKKALGSVTAEEFPHIMKVLGALRTLSTTAGAQELADCIAELADLEAEFQINDAEAVDRLFSCSRQALPFLKKGGSPMRFINYFMDQVLPALAKTPEEEAESTQLDALKVLAELFQVSPSATECEALFDPIFALLLEHLPSPPTAADNGEATEKEEPQLQFSVVECLLFIFYQIARQCPDKMVSETTADLRTRLQYFGLGCQSSMRKLKASQEGAAQAEDEQSKTKAIALKTMQNISFLIKAFFKVPVGTITDFCLSWVVRPKRTPVTAPTSVPIAVKRSSSSATPATLEGGELPKRPMTGKELRELYKAQKKDEPKQESQGGRGGWHGGRGGFRRGGRGGWGRGGQGYGRGYGRGYRGRGGWRSY